MKKLMITFLVLSLFGLGFSQDKVNYEEEYMPKLKAAQEALAKAEAEIASEETQIGNLNGQLIDTESKISQIWNEIYQILGTDEAGVKDYRSRLDALDRNIGTMSSLPGEEIFKRKAEIDAFEAELNDLRANKISALTEFTNRIQEPKTTLKG
jgi:septal ring factor EnvC (AmiA/AmiB activator)